MTTPQSMEPQHTLLTAVARLDELRARESLAGFGSDDEALDERTGAEDDPAADVVVDHLERELGREHGAAQVHQDDDPVAVVGAPPTRPCASSAGGAS